MSDDEVVATLAFLFRAVVNELNEYGCSTPIVPGTTADALCYALIPYAQTLESVYSCTPSDCPGVYLYEFVEGIMAPLLAKHMRTHRTMMPLPEWETLATNELTTWGAQPNENL